MRYGRNKFAEGFDVSKKLLKQAPEGRHQGRRHEGKALVTAATVLRSAIGKRLRAQQARPRKRRPRHDLSAKVYKARISCTVRIPSPSIAWRKCSSCGHHLSGGKGRAKATLGTLPRARYCVDVYGVHAMTPNTNTMKFECIVLLRRDDTAQPRARNRRHGSTRRRG